MINNKQMELYKNWYGCQAVRFEIIKFLRTRETAFLTKDKDFKPSGIRMMRVHSVQHLDIVLDATAYRLDHPYSMYMSVAKYKTGIPYQNLNFVERAKDTRNQEFNRMAENEIFDYSFFIDIDINSHDELEFAKDSAILLSDFFDRFNVPYEMRFSGMGFHFVVPMGNLKYSFNHTDTNNIYNLYISIAKFLSDKVSELIDTKIYDSKRLIKAPYSLAVYGNEMYVCLPFLTKKELVDFKLEDVNPQLLLNDAKKLFKRGTYLFNPTGSLVSFIQKNIKYIGD